MDSQTEVCIFRLEIFLSFWRMRRLAAPPTTVPHPRRGQRWGQPSCTCTYILSPFVDITQIIKFCTHKPSMIATSSHSVQVSPSALCRPPPRITVEQQSSWPYQLSSLAVGSRCLHLQNFKLSQCSDYKFFLHS